MKVCIVTSMAEPLAAIVFGSILGTALPDHMSSAINAFGERPGCDALE